MNATTLSKYILSKHKNITPMKLQKLLYYVKVWGIVSEKNFLVADFEKWSYGPVNSEIYKLYKSFGKAPISLTSKDIIIDNPLKDKESIDFILECYLPYSGLSLSAMTHEEQPWKETALNQVISDTSIKKYYSYNEYKIQMELAQQEFNKIFPSLA